MGGPGEDGPDRGGDHLSGAFGDLGQHVAQDVSSLKERGRAKGGLLRCWLLSGVRDWRLLFPW